jgi:aminocarboxymuconate-semialdehyde decarboxylase
VTAVIDLHAHLIPPRLVEALRRDGARYGVDFGGPADAPTIRLDGSNWTKPLPIPLTRVAERLETIDRQGIDIQVQAPWIDFSGYTMPVPLAEKFAELQNETIAEVAAAHSGRFLGAATVPMQDSAVAIRVLERALAMGHRSVQVATYFGGSRFLDHEALFPFWEAVSDKGVLVYVHPYDEQPPPGTKDFFLHNVVNYPLQTAIALPRMIFAGVFDRFPRLKICFPHGGGYLPYQFGRVRRAAQVRPEPKSLGYSGDPLEVLRRIWFDTILHNPASIRYLAEMVGADRLVMGSDYPFDMNDPDPVGSVHAALPEGVRDAVTGGTAARLLGLDHVAEAA